VGEKPAIPAPQHQKFTARGTFPEKAIRGIRNNAWPGLCQTRLRRVIDYIDDLYDITAQPKQRNPTIPRPPALRQVIKNA
jgi:hypothetical protein